MVSKPCEHSGIACRPAKCAGTCDFSSLALLFGQVLFGNIYAFFGKMSRFTRFFVKYRHLCNFLAKCFDLRTFSSVPPKQSKLLSVPPLSFYQPWGGG